MATRKRGNNEGSVYQDGRGLWRATIMLDNGRRKYLSARTRQEVAAKLSAAQTAKTQGMPVITDRQMLGHFLKRWLEDSARPKLRPRTFDSYRMIVNRHLAPALGRRHLTELSPHDIQAYMNNKRTTGLSARTVLYHRAVLRRALGQALKWGMVARNVATLVDPPRIERHEVEPLDVEQAETLLKAAQGHRLEALFTVALALGLRQGEVLGLRWVDVDLDGAVLHVRKQVQRIEGKLTLVEPKTARSRRSVALPGFAVDALRRHKVRQLEERLLAGTRWQDHGLVFPSTIGTPMDAGNLIGQYHRLLERAGLPRRRFHDLRHTCATLLLVQGEDLRVVMEVLGHSQIALTANTYQHVQQRLKRGAADKMQALFAVQR